MELLDLESIPLSLYIHFPWCVKKCPYCDFNSHPARDSIPERAYVDSLIEDFKQQIPKVKGRQIETIFMGGGTPSLISPKEIHRLLSTIQSSGCVKSQSEITLEANPGAIDADHFDAYLSAGVNRLSIGVQSFNDVLLKKIGRIHSAEDARCAIEQAYNAGFKRINLDLMYGLPGQDLHSSKADIERAISLGDEFDLEHLSVYQLTIEPNTEFAVRPPKLPQAERFWEMQLQAQALLAGAHFKQYEVSAYTRDKPCQHNVNYWQFGDYLAIGAGAHGKLSGFNTKGELHIERYWNHRHPKAYMAAKSQLEFCSENKMVPDSDIDFEYLMNALRLKGGFDLSQYEVRTKRKPATLLKQLGKFIMQGYLETKNNRVVPTIKGYQYLDTILLDCLPETASVP